jgi:hypothetical protein
MEVKIRMLTILTTVVLFGLMFSSCKGCKDEPKVSGDNPASTPVTPPGVSGEEISRLKDEMMKAIDRVITITTSGSLDENLDENLVVVEAWRVSARALTETDERKWASNIYNMYHYRYLCATSLKEECDNNIAPWEGNSSKGCRDDAEKRKRQAGLLKDVAYANIEKIKADPGSYIEKIKADPTLKKYYDENNKEKNVLIEAWDKLQPLMKPADDAWDAMIIAVEAYRKALGK